MKKWFEKEIEGKEFVLINSGRIYTIKQLADELVVMDESVYYYHTGQGRNDFYNWIKDVFNLEELAERVANANNKYEAAITIYKYIIDSLNTRKTKKTKTLKRKKKEVKGKVKKD